MPKKLTAQQEIALTKLGEQLQDLLKYKNISPSEIARASGLARQTIHDMLKGSSSRLGLTNFIPFLKGSILLHIFTTEAELSSWVRKLCTARGEDGIERIDDLGDQGQELHNLLDQTQAQTQEQTNITYKNLQGLRVIGRESIIDAICTRLEEVRFLTLTGLPGVGKTEIALQVREAVKRRKQFTRVQVIYLEEETDGDKALQAITKAFKISKRTMRTLFILDNCEQFDNLERGLNRLLRNDAYAHISILATSRTTLSFAEEIIEPLPAPKTTKREEVNTLLEYPAVQLFLTSANFNKQVFTLDETTTFPIIALCEGLDGLPLAILLATSWLGHYTIGALHEELMSKRIYTKHYDHSESERHESLNTLIAWSYNLLSEAEKKLFRRIAIFPEGCSIAELARVCNLDDLPINKASFQQCVETLSKHHLVTLTNGRVTMSHATIRDFAEQQLLQASEGLEAIEVTQQYINLYYQLVTELFIDALRKQQATPEQAQRKDQLQLNIFLTNEDRHFIERAKKHIDVVYNAIHYIRYLFVDKVIKQLLGESEYTAGVQAWMKIESENYDIDLHFSGDIPVGGELVYFHKPRPITKQEEKLIVSFYIAMLKAEEQGKNLFPTHCNWHTLIFGIGGEEAYKLQYTTPDNIKYLLHGILERIIPMAIEQSDYLLPNVYAAP